MRRLAFTLALALALTSAAWPQEPSEAGHQAEQHDPWIWWKWVNFAILAGGLGYLISKHAPALFRERAAEIEKSIAESLRAKKDAEAQSAAVELRLTGLQQEIAGLRATAGAEIAAEGQRISRETEQRLQRIQEQSAQEIALMSRGLRDQLRRYSAQLALDLARDRIRAKLTPELQAALADGFLQDLHRRARPDARP